MRINRLDKDIILKDKELIERENRMLILLSKVEFKEELKTPTAYVTIVKNAEGDWKIRIYYNPEFLAKMNYRFVLFHEICHVLLWHFNRGGQRNVKIWNIATDLAINSILQSDYEFYIKGSDEGIIKRLFFPTYFKLPELRSAEEYYDILKEKQLEKFEKFVLFDEHCHSDDKSSSSGNDKSDSSSRDNDDTEGSDSSSGSSSKSKKSESKSSSSSFDDSEPSSSGSSSSFDEVEYDLNDSIPSDVLEEIRDFVDTVTKYGKGSYLIKRMLEIERKDRNDKRWKRILERYISDLVESYVPNYLRRNRRLISFPKLFIEDIKLKDAIKLIIALDSSGSIKDSDLVFFVTETISILSDIIQNVEILVFDEGFEVYVSGNVEYVRQALSKFERRRNGGTSFVEICSYYEQSKDAQIMIVFTDLIGKFPSFPVTKPVIWCISNNIKPPFGYVIPLKE